MLSRIYIRNAVRGVILRDGTCLFQGNVRADSADMYGVSPMPKNPAPYAVTDRMKTVREADSTAINAITIGSVRGTPNPNAALCVIPGNGMNRKPSD